MRSSNSSASAPLLASSAWFVVGALDRRALRPGNAVGLAVPPRSASSGLTGLALAGYPERGATSTARPLTLVSWFGEWFGVAGFILMVAEPVPLIPTGRSTSPAWRRVLWAFSPPAGAVAVVLAGTPERQCKRRDSAAGGRQPDRSRGARRRVGEASCRSLVLLRGDCRDRIHGRPLPPRQRGRARRLKLVVVSAVCDGDLRFRRGRLRRQSPRCLDLLVIPGVFGYSRRVRCRNPPPPVVRRRPGHLARALVYGALTLLLGAAYVSLVLVGQALSSSFAGRIDLAIAISTLRRRCAVPPAPLTGTTLRRPALLPPPLRRAAHPGGVRCAVARAGRPRDAEH